MELNKLTVIYYSPTHTSRQIARSIARGMGIARMQEVDLTTDASDELLEVTDSICIVAAPVYGGLLAPVAAQRLSRLHAVNCVAVPVVVYGNRDYEDALVQLRDMLDSSGMTPVSGAAFVGEHSYSRPGMPIAEGRPDSCDLSIAEHFGEEVWHKIAHQLAADQKLEPSARDFALRYDAPLNELLPPVQMPGNIPYKTLSAPTPQAPVTDDMCCGCGECVPLCPIQAIRIEGDRSVTAIDLCTKCCACVKFCPVGARTFDTPYTAMLHQRCGTRREPECFV